MAKGLYVGASTEIPIYESQTVSVKKPFYSIDPDLFDIYHSEDYWFEDYWGSNDCFEANNLGIDNSTAYTSFIAKKDIPYLSIDFDCYSEEGYDELFVSIWRNGYFSEYVGHLSGSDASNWSGSLAENDSIDFEYIKDGGYSANPEYATIYNIDGYYYETTTQQVQVGTQTMDVARRVKKQYTSVNGIARQIKKAYAEVNGVARNYFSMVAWEKYWCSQVSSSGYEYKDYYSPRWGSSNAGYFYPDYEFSSDSGFTMKGSSIYRKADGSNGDPNDIIGMYRKDYTSFETTFYAPGYVILQAVNIVDRGIPMIECDAIGFAEETEETYEPYGSSHGTFHVGDGELPEKNGELIAGSPNTNYCVIRIDGELYYYEKV